jgi:hypothetical protein
MGCSSGTSGNTTAVNPVTTTGSTTNAATGTYNLTVTGNDSVDSAVSNSATLVLTVH